MDGNLFTFSSCKKRIQTASNKQETEPHSFSTLPHVGTCSSGPVWRHRIWPVTRPGTPQLREAGCQTQQTVSIDSKNLSTLVVQQQQQLPSSGITSDVLKTHMLQNPTDSTELVSPSFPAPLGLPSSRENAPTTFTEEILTL